jgi:hypothetical protein
VGQPITLSIDLITFRIKMARGIFQRIEAGGIKNLRAHAVIVR